MQKRQTILKNVQAQLTQARADAKRAQDAAGVAQAQVDKLGKDLKTAHDELANLREVNQGKDLRLQQSQKDLAKAQGDLTTAKDALEKAQADVKKAKDDSAAEISKARLELGAAQNELRKQQELVKKLSDQCDAAVADAKRKCENDVKKAQEENARIKKQWDDAAGLAARNCNEAIAKLNEQIAKLQKQIQDAGPVYAKASWADQLQEISDAIDAQKTTREAKTLDQIIGRITDLEENYARNARR